MDGLTAHDCLLLKNSGCAKGLVCTSRCNHNVIIAELKLTAGQTLEGWLAVAGPLFKADIGHLRLDIANFFVLVPHWLFGEREVEQAASSTC